MPNPQSLKCGINRPANSLEWCECAQLHMFCMQEGESEGVWLYLHDFGVCVCVNAGVL